MGISYFILLFLLLIMRESLAIASISIFSLDILLCLVGGVVYFLKRNTFPIYARLIPVVYYSLAGVILMIIPDLLRASYIVSNRDPPCFLSAIKTTLLFAVFATSFLLRTVKYGVFYRLPKIRLMLNSTDKGKKEKGVKLAAWWQKQGKRYVNERFYVMVTFLAGLIPAVFAAIFFPLVEVK